jgi:hypothetical protein
VTPPDLTRLSPEEKDALILALFAQLAAAHDKIAALEARLDELTRPPKTPDNSSKPPSQGQKPKSPGRRGPPAAQEPPRRGPAGTARSRSRQRTYPALRSLRRLRTTTHFSLSRLREPVCGEFFVLAENTSVAQLCESFTYR